MFALNTLVVFFVSLVAVTQAAPIVSGNGQGASYSEVQFRIVTKMCIAATYYQPGLGACGGTNNQNDLIVAVSTPVFNGFP